MFSWHELYSLTRLALILAALGEETADTSNYILNISGPRKITIIEEQLLSNKFSRKLSIWLPRRSALWIWQLVSFTAVIWGVTQRSPLLVYILKVLKLWFDVIGFRIRLFKYSLPYVYLGVIEVHQFWFTKREGKLVKLFLLPFRGYKFPSTVHICSTILPHSLRKRTHEWAKNEIYNINGTLKEPFSSGTWRTIALFSVAVLVILVILIGINIFLKNQ